MTAKPHIAVIGAGAFGGWTALHLRDGGARVTLLDAWGPGNSRASSGGETRVMRGAYGHDRGSTEMAARALKLWEKYERRWKRTLKDFLKRVTYKSGKRLVLKSPPHTARIKPLKQMFPGAIFLHIARDDMGPTQGCIAFAREDLLQLVPLLTPQTRLRIHSLSAAEEKPSAVGDDVMKQFEDFDEQDW